MSNAVQTPTKALAQEPEAARPDPRRWLILAVVALAQLMVVLDATIVNIALPSAQQALHFSNIERQWVVTGYALAFGSLLLLGGRLTDLIGRKKTFIVGLIGFAAASAVGGAADSFGMLVAARSCQGAVGALLAPAALSLLTTTFEGTKDRGKGCGVVRAIACACGAVGFAAFGYVDTRASHPLLPLRVVLDRNRAAAYLSILVTGAGMFGIFLFLTYYLQETLGYSPVTTGVAFLPLVGAIIVCANLANIVLLPRIGPRLLVAPGMLAAAAGLAWLTRIGPHSSYAADVLPPLLLAAIGLGFVMSPSMNTGTSGVASSDAGVASAVVNTGQQVGGSIGTSLLNTVAASAAASYLAGHFSPRLMVGGRPAPALVELAP